MARHVRERLCEEGRVSADLWQGPSHTKREAECDLEAANPQEFALVTRYGLYKTRDSPAKMKTDLIGVWSADALFAPGSQEDEILVFRSDGTGWIEWLNFAAHEVEFFHWEPTSSGWYLLSRQGRFERDPHNLKRYIEKEPNREYEHLPIGVQQVPAPFGGLIWQLEMEFSDWNAGLYGLTIDDPDSYPRPQTPT